jgi:hypothetical protein
VFFGRRPNFIFSRATLLLKTTTPIIMLRALASATARTTSVIPPAAAAPRLLLLSAARMEGAASASSSAGGGIEARLAELGYKLPIPAKPAANYVMCKRIGNLIYTGEEGTHGRAGRRVRGEGPQSEFARPVFSQRAQHPFSPLSRAAGHLPQPAEGGLITGKVGSELTTEQGYEAARVVALNLLATIKGE